MIKLKKALLLGFFFSSPLFLTGCLGDLIGLGCGFMEDPDHCYQSAAVQESEEEKCAKISGEGFSGSNPPRDKCYLQIAENTGNVEICDKIEGGMMSYSKEECVKSVNEKNGNTDEGSKEVGNKEVDPEEFRKAREEVMSDIEDDDVKSSIAKAFTEFRSNNPGLTLEQQIAKMEEIKENQETLKRYDEEANILMDQVKETASEFANDTFDDLYGDDVKKYQEAMEAKARKLAEEYGGEKLTAGIAQLEELKGKYDKASEQFEKVNEQIEKLKKVYEEVSEVKGKIDDINKLVADGKIDLGRAKVLHGAVYLGKGLEYATSYVPVFGSTISTISKEVMDATTKFATKRAERTTALDKCIDDPENCDPTGITPY
jgi:hypothetical protein